jgi:hypothetical protein
MAEQILPPNLAALLQSGYMPAPMAPAEGPRNALTIANLARAGKLDPNAVLPSQQLAAQQAAQQQPMPPTLSGVENRAPLDMSAFLQANAPAQPSGGPAPLRTEPVPATPMQNLAMEMTGLPALHRGSENLARGVETSDPWTAVRGIGQMATAGPGRAGGLASFLLSSAEAQTPDPREKRIRDLNADITRREKLLEGYATKKFESKTARQEASKPHLDAIGAARAEATRLREEMDAEAATERQRAEAETRSAEWRNTPTARAYPGAPAAIAGLGMATGFTIPYFRTRAAVSAYNSQIADITTRWRGAIDRAKNTQLSTRNRTAAANEARQLQAQFEALSSAGPRAGGHARAFGEGAVPTELALGTPTLIDYLTSTPGSQLRDYTMHSINPVENPGEVLGRYGFGLGIGGALGELGHMLGERGVDRPAGYAAETQALNKRYQKPRARR